MARYLETAAEANNLAREIMTYIVAENDKPRVAELLARLVNLSVRSCPRAVQHTVRLNIVQRACKDLPVKVSMATKVDERTGRTYHALVTQPLGVETATVEGANNDE